MNRRNFLKSAAGLFVASAALAVPERRVFALDQTMITPSDPRFPRTITMGDFSLEGRDIYPRGFDLMPYEIIKVDDEYMWVGPNQTIMRGMANTEVVDHDPSAPIHILGPVWGRPV